MLLGLLSGIRDARSPLIVGYVILLALWLLLFHALPEGHVALHRHYPELARSRPNPRVKSPRRSSACCGSYAAITSLASTVAGGAGSSAS
jgi:hypothetical protein